MSGSPDVIRTSIHTNLECTSQRGRNPSAGMLPGNGLIDSQQTFASPGSDVHRSSNHRVNRSSNHTRGARHSRSNCLSPLFNGQIAAGLVPPPGLAALGDDLQLLRGGAARSLEQIQNLGGLAAIAGTRYWLQLFGGFGRFVALLG